MCTCLLLANWLKYSAFLRQKLSGEFCQIKTTSLKKRVQKKLVISFFSFFNIFFLCLFRSHLHTHSRSLLFLWKNKAHYKMYLTIMTNLIFFKLFVSFFILFFLICFYFCQYVLSFDATHTQNDLRWFFFFIFRLVKKCD